jgi:hypothetical protein
MQRQLHMLHIVAPSTLPPRKLPKACDYGCILRVGHIDVLINDRQRDSAVEENEGRVALTYAKLVGAR